MADIDHTHLLKIIPNKNPDNIIDLSNETLMIDLKTNLPSDSDYKHILVVINLTSNQIDLEALQNKNTDTVTKAMQKILNRNNIDNIKNTKRIISDRGAEFTSSQFKTMLNNNNITLILYNRYHHNSTSQVERMVGTIAKIIKDYLTHMTIETGRRYNKWTFLLPHIIETVNETAIQKWELKDIIANPIMPKNLYPLNTKVHRKMQTPHHTLNNQVKFQFRVGDKRYTINTITITDYRIRDNRPISYILNNDYSISYQHHELMPAKV